LYCRKGEAPFVRLFSLDRQQADKDRLW